MGKEKILALSVLLALIKFKGLHGIRDKQETKIVLSSDVTILYVNIAHQMQSMFSYIQYFNTIFSSSED